MAARTASSVDQESLRLIIRRKLQNGRLPNDGIKKVWSSPSDGETCNACDTILSKDQLVMEGITLDLGRRPLQFTSNVSRSGITRGASPIALTCRSASHAARCVGCLPTISPEAIS
jgi:hypothetical protein